MILDDLDFGRSRRPMKVAKLGEILSVSYEIYVKHCPPGEPDENALERAGNFANERGFIIENRIAERHACFWEGVIPVRFRRPLDDVQR